MVRQRNITLQRNCIFLSGWVGLMPSHEVTFPCRSTYWWPRWHWMPLAGNEFQKLFKASTVLNLWSSFPLVFCPGSAGVLAVTFLFIYTANTNNKPAHNIHCRGLLTWQSEVRPFSCFPPRHDFRLLIDIKITFLLLHFIYSKYFFFFPTWEDIAFLVELILHYPQYLG